MKSNFSLRGLLIELRTDTLSEKAIPAVSVGFTTGLGLLVAQIAYATFIFSGSLAPYSSQGVGLVLFGNFATCLIIAVLGNYRGVISGLSPALILVMAAIGLTIETESDALFVTVVAALMIGASFRWLDFSHSREIPVFKPRALYPVSSRRWIRCGNRWCSVSGIFAPDGC